MRRGKDGKSAGDMGCMAQRRGLASWMKLESAYPLVYWAIGLVAGVAGQDFDGKLHAGCMHW